MAQLVARLHGMEKVGGSNPPSSTEVSRLIQSGGFFISVTPDTILSDSYVSFNLVTPSSASVK